MEQINSDDIWIVCYFCEVIFFLFFFLLAYIVYAILYFVKLDLFYGLFWIIWLYSSNFYKGNLMFLVIFKNYLELKNLSEVIIPEQTLNVKFPQRAWLTWPTRVIFFKGRELEKQSMLHAG